MFGDTSSASDTSAKQDTSSKRDTSQKQNLLLPKKVTTKNAKRFTKQVNWKDIKQVNRKNTKRIAKKNIIKNSKSMYVIKPFHNSDNTYMLFIKILNLP